VDFIDHHAANFIDTSDNILTLYVSALWNLKRRKEGWNLFVRVFNLRDSSHWRDAEFHKKQEAAINRGIPPILLVTIPKSGSSFLHNTLRKGLNVPYTALNPMGLFPDLLEPRVECLSKGGSSALKHVTTTERDLALLEKYGIKKIVFHFRDLRQATLSWIHHSASDEIKKIPRSELLNYRKEIKNQEKFEFHYRKCIIEQAEHLDKWLEVIESNRFEFLITNFDDLQHEEKLFRKILDFYDIPHTEFDWSVLSIDKKDRAGGHFRKGMKDEWKEVLSLNLQDEINSLIKSYPRISALMNINPNIL